MQVRACHVGATTLFCLMFEGFVFELRRRRAGWRERLTLLPQHDLHVEVSERSEEWPTSVGSRVEPEKVLAVLRLITSSNVVGCSTGRSPGFAPLRILST